MSLSIPLGVFTICSVLFSVAAGYTIPQNAADPALRKQAVDAIRAGFLYGPAVAGGPFYPTGDLGNAKVALDIANIQREAGPNSLLVQDDVAEASNSTEQYEGLDTLEDYLLLYPGNWDDTLPDGPAPGALTNYSRDDFFSMERLANNPFSVRRLPKTSKIPFEVDSETAVKITGSSLQQLLSDGRLFYADHRAQGAFPKTQNKFAAACDAYFYIATSGKFLPLAVRTNVAGNLVYTPADSTDDWTLAKILFNVNDFFFTQTWHLASTHETVQIAWMAAIRTLSVEHPIYALLDRITYELFAIQPLAQSFLFDNGTAFDTLFPVTGTGARDFVTELYFNGTGAFQAHYFKTDLENRGLLNGDGPKLAHFPFYENALVIHNAQHDFIHAFVKSFYKDNAAVRGDAELQAWATEANGPAKAIDFPTKFDTRDAIIDALTHIAHLVSTVHHSVNTNNLIAISATLPMHPSSLYKPVPTKKGETSVVSYLPPLRAALAQFQIEGTFARPLLANTNRTLAYMFDSPQFLDGTNDATRTAATKFQDKMKAFSAKIQARKFDRNGFSQGAPFIWKTLDPLKAPFSVSI